RAVSAPPPRRFFRRTGRSPAARAHRPRHFPVWTPDWTRVWIVLTPVAHGTEDDHHLRSRRRCSAARYRSVRELRVNVPATPAAVPASRAAIPADRSVISSSVPDRVVRSATDRVPGTACARVPRYERASSAAERAEAELPFRIVWPSRIASAESAQTKSRPAVVRIWVHRPFGWPLRIRRRGYV